MQTQIKMFLTRMGKFKVVINGTRQVDLINKKL